MRTDEHSMDLNTYKTSVLPIKNKLYRYALRMLCNPAEAKDVVQEVLIKVWNQRDRLAQVDNLEAWCMRLTKNQTIDKLRLKHHQSQDIDSAYDMKTDTQSPYEMAAYHDMLDHVRQLLEHLPDNQKQVMHLRDIEGMTYQEISEALDMPMGQVKVNLFRARQQVRLQLLKTQSYGL